MSVQYDPDSTTRTIFMGEAALTDGFQLIGFETVTDPSDEEMTRILRTLSDEQQKALVILDERLAASNNAQLKKVRREGGRIIITKVPSLNDPESFQFDVDQMVRSMLGDSESEGEI